MGRLPRRAVLRHLDRLTDDVTPRQLSRLRALADLIDDDGRIPMPRALDAATPGGSDQKAQDAFRKFRAALDDAAAAAGVELRLVSDQRKAPPADRFCWFEGADAIGDEIAERSQREAARGTGDEPVPATVSEVIRGVVHVERGVVHVETALEASDAVRRRERQFVELLAEQLAARPGYRLTSASDIALGLAVDSERRRLREAADVVVELDSAAARRHAHPGSTARRPIRVALEGVARGAEPAGPAGPAGDVLHGAGQPFSQRTQRPARLEFVEMVLGLIDDRLGEPGTPRPEPEGWARLLADRHALDSEPGTPWPESEGWARRLADRRALDVEPVPPKAGETSLAADVLAAAGPRRFSEPVPAVERLLVWATDTSAAARHLCALLGDVGMGKTTTVKLLTQALLDLRGDDRSAPLPILFDLRDLPPALAREGAGHPRILEALLAAGDLGTGPSAAQVLDLVAAGNCVLIFDGLDEVLVHLDPHAGQVFTRRLWRATEDAWRSRPASQRADRPSRLLLSCRTHYFRSIRHETTHFTGQHRDGPAGPDYLALLMLPFDEEQVRAYLAANVPGADVDRLLELIDSVHNLREIAERPLTLRMIAEQLETVEHAKLAGRTVRAVDLYASFVMQWLERDDGKHSLLPEHKQLLMEHLAAQLWRSGRTTWEVADVEQWLLEFLAGRPDLELHYPARTPDLWKEDLRTATFLVRRGDDTFGFAHTSLREYFLARYLGRALELPAEQAREHWQLPVPSPETLDFLGQWLAGRDEERHGEGKHSPHIATLAELAAHAPAGRADAAAVLAFAYSLAAARGGHPAHRPAGAVLAGADLAGWWIDGGGRRLDLRGMSFAGADLTGAVIRDADLSGADLAGANLTRAEIHDTDLNAADLRRTGLAGTLFRRCDLNAAHWAGSTAHRTQALLCRSAPSTRRPGWLVAPTNAPRRADARLSSFTGHTSLVTHGAWSPDGTHILTTSYDNTARIWN
ncbi:pentapeptide repeat-containing protein, partial [Frankia sp. CiP1_Cm_nod1]|uniref:pentapeptide repeat-containing protein n=2 Tax=unclassified Frankia TaxID=2632575 RepID=UPI002023BE2C